jgi:hypothetical protein
MQPNNQNQNSDNQISPTPPSQNYPEQAANSSVAEEPAPSVNYEQRLSTGSPTNRNKGRWIILVIVVAAILVATAGAGIWFIVNQGTKPLVKPTNLAATNTLSSSYDNFKQQGIREFTDNNKRAVLKAYSDLTTGFIFKNGVAPTDTTKQLVALSTSYQYSQNSSTKELQRYKLYLLYTNDLSSKPADITDENASKPNTAETRAIYLKYQDANLTQQLKDTIASRGLAKKAAKALNISEGTLKNYDIYAMNFDTGSSQEKSFVSDLKYTGWVPSLWTDVTPGGSFIGFTSAYAKQFITTADPTTEAFFLHEFSHTQSNLMVGGLGYTLEERKAEEISGNKGAYYDVKQLFIYMEVFTGTNILKPIQDNPTDSTKVYTSIYKLLGVNLANDLASSFPVAYTTSASTPIKIVATNNNFDNVLKLALEKGEESPAALQHHVNDRAKKLISIFGDKQKAINDLNVNVADKYKLSTVTTEMTKVINSLQ